MRRSAVHLVLLGLALSVAACGAEAPASGARDGGAADASAVAADSGASISDAGMQVPAGDAGASADAGPLDECDPVDQTGCTAPESKCVVEGPSEAAACVAPGPADLPLGAPCQGRDCIAGLACVRESAGSADSVCVMVCNFESGEGCEALGPEFECRTRLSQTRWGACQQLPLVCDPYDQSPCEADEACQPFLRRTGIWEFRCRAAGTGTEGEICGPGNPACARGLACVSSRTGAAVCRKICQLNQDCPNMAQCNGMVSEPPFMYCSE